MIHFQDIRFAAWSESQPDPVGSCWELGLSKAVEDDRTPRRFAANRIVERATAFGTGGPGGSEIACQRHHVRAGSIAQGLQMLPSKSAGRGDSGGCSASKEKPPNDAADEDEEGGVDSAEEEDGDDGGSDGEGDEVKGHVP